LSENQIEPQIRGFLPFFAALVLGTLVLFAPQIFNDPDTYWHLATGGWILDHGRVPHVDVFSYTKAGAPWVAHEWLSDVVMALAWRAGGWSGLAVLFATAAGAAAWLLVRRLSLTLSGVTLLLVSVLALAGTLTSMLARPQVLMLPVLLLWVGELMTAREQHRAPRLAAALLMTLWANLHGSFVFGFLLAGAFGLDALVEEKGRRWSVIRDWGVFAAAITAAALLTPHGINGLIFPFQIMNMTILPYIIEWRAADFSQPTAFEAAILVTLFVCLSRGVRVRLVPLLLLLGLLHMSLQHIRHQFVLVMVAPLLLAEPLAQALGQKPSRAPLRPLLMTAAAVLTAILFTVRLAVPLTRPDGPISPVTALAHVPPELAAQPVFNDYGFGGYLIFKGVRPFIDGRADMYGDAFSGDYFRADRSDPALFKTLIQRYRVAWSILPPNSKLIPLLEEAGWKRLYADRFAVVLQRPATVPGRRPD
jgi:hypothetical protein